MNKTYLISLTPTGKFFFGDDMTFAVNDKETSFTSYIISSRLFPQQTSLLGMLRFLILRNDQDGAFDPATQTIKNRTKAIQLIGKKSFDANSEGLDFGVIKKVYPCHIQALTNNEWQSLLLISKGDKLSIDLSKTSAAVINGKQVKIPTMKYDCKEEYPAYYQSPTDSTKHYQFENSKDNETPYIFKKDMSNGINRDIETGRVADNALFKQESYRMNDGYRFAFYAEIDLDDLTKYNGQIVQVGADNSQFVIVIEECAPQEESAATGRCATLTSPAFIRSCEIERVLFAITETIPFRCMKTMTETAKPYNKRDFEYGYSEKFTLYDTGSQFYFENAIDANDFSEALKAHANFYKIGYNHCIIK